jgi:hypothetical protein
LLLLEIETQVTESIVLIGQDLKVTVNRTVTENCDACGKWKEMALNRFGMTLLRKPKPTNVCKANGIIIIINNNNQVPTGHISTLSIFLKLARNFKCG